MKKLILFTIFTASVFLSAAQYFQTGQDPASIHWRQINTKNFQLIYPDYYEVQAQKLAGTLDAVYPYGSYSLKYNPKKIPVILHTQTVQSNGLVAWAPKRAEFYTTPHQSIYAQDWLEQLALHEFRHVVQIDKIHSNMPGWLKVLFGEQVSALAFGGYLPWWFIEGDAVVTETALSNFGRGRFPSFLMEHRAQVVEKGAFSYDKAYLGSYRDFVPDHYKLGYYLVGHTKERYGNRVWEEVLTRTGQKPLSLSPVNKTLKDYTGLNKKQLYQSVFDSLQTVWLKEDKSFQTKSFDVFSRPNAVFTNYRYNHWLNDSVLFSYKTSYDEIPSFVKVEPDGKEKKLVSPGIVFNESASYIGEWIVWSEQISDLRWQHSGHSLLRLFNTGNKARIEIKTEHKSFSPVISPQKDKIAVVETDFSSNYYLSVYQLPEGKLLQRFQTPGNNYFFTPEWLTNNQVAVIVLTKEGKRLATVDFSDGKMDMLTTRDLGELKHLRAHADWLYFISSYSGKNSLYRLNLANRKIEKVFEPRFGVESPAISPDGKNIALSDYTAGGFRLIQVSLENTNTSPLDDVEPARYPLAEKLAAQEPGIPVFPDSTEEKYDSEKYNKAANLFKFHSWAPVYINTESYEFFPGVSLMSQNVLGTSETVIGYKWDHTENAGRFTLDYTFKGWYPVFDFSLTQGPRASSYYQIMQNTDNQGNVVSQDTVLRKFTWGQTNAGLNVRLPLNLNKGPFYRIIQPEVQYGFNFYNGHDSAPEQFRGGNFHSLGYRLYFHQLLRQSYRDMYPDFGIILDGSYRHSPVGLLRAGEISSLQSVLYLPGVLKNHGIKVYAGAQHKNAGGRLGFSDVVRYARGWGRINTTDIYTAGADYKLPLFYPDMNLLGLLYVRRIKGALFADYTRLKGNFYNDGQITGTFIKDITSMGTELSADVNFVRFYAPSSIGFRASYLPEMKNVYFDFLFSIDFTSF